jgi:hypothetical protein
MIDEPGSQYKKLATAVSYLATCGHRLKHGNDVNQRVFEVTRKDYLRSLVAHLRERLKEIPVLGSCYRILTPSLYKGRTEKDLETNAEIHADFNAVSDHFTQAPAEGKPPRFTKEQLQKEFDLVLPIIWGHRDKTKTVTRARAANETSEAKVVDEAVDDFADDADPVGDAAEPEDPEPAGPISLFNPKKKRRRKKLRTVEEQAPLEAVDIIALFLRKGSEYGVAFPCFAFLMACYAVVIVSTAECERVFSLLKLIKTALRNRLCNINLEKLMHVAVNGPSLQVFVSSGMLTRALTYFFSRAKRNARPPREYIDHRLAIKLDKLEWGTSCTFPYVVARDQLLDEQKQEIAEKQKQAAIDDLQKLAWPELDGGDDCDEGFEVEEELLQALKLSELRYSSSHTGLAANLSLCVATSGGKDAKGKDATGKAKAGAKTSGKKNKATVEPEVDGGASASGPSKKKQATEDLRAPRTASGRVRIQREFLSYNHHNDKHATMLFYSNA